MADVDLSLAISSAGVPQALADLRKIRSEGKLTGDALSQLAQSSVLAGRNIDKAFSGGGGAGSKQFKAAMDQTGKGAVSLTQQLRELEKEYARLSSAQVGASASQRLTTGGGAGGLAGGLAIANQIAALRAALGADAVKDQIQVERELQAVRDQGAARLAAQASLRGAQDERELASMKSKERAALVLTRAEEAYTQAVRARYAAFRTTSGDSGIDSERRTLALRAEADAYRAVTAAQQQNSNERQASAGDSFRYLILAGLANQAAQSILSVGQASISSSMLIERSFADVDRTFDGTQSQLDGLRERLRALSTESPVSITDLMGIATLGNQLGVAAADIEGFTTTIAQYTAVSGQSAEDAATAFGKISNLTGLAASQYSNLASAITYTARTTVATEATIQRTATEITALASGAGFSADAIVGLAGALSSLAIPPERARGALSLYFGALNTAVAEGGPKLEAFAALTGKTTKELDTLVRQNKGQEIFTAFISGLSDLDNVAKTTALDTLGLSTIRVDQTMRALSQNVPLVTKSLEGAKTAFDDNTEIANQYATIQATLNSLWIEFQNAVQNAAGAVGDEFAPAAKDALIATTNLIVGLTAFSKTPIGSAMLKIASATAILIGVLAAIVGAAALAKASLVVLTFAIQGMGISTATKGLLGWLAALVTTSGATRAAAVNTVTLRVALAETTAGMTASTVATRALGVAMNFLKIAIPLIALTLAVAGITALAEKIDKASNPSKTLTDDLTGLKEALTMDNKNTIDSALDKIITSSNDTHTPISDFNRSILAAIEIQKQAEQALSGTNNKIDEQAFKLGDASKAWIADALKTQDDLKDIIDGRDWWEQATEDWSKAIPILGSWISGLGGGDSADTKVSRDQLEKLIMGGLDVNELAQIAIEQGKDAALKSYDGFQKGFEEANPGDTSAADFGKVLPGILDSVVSAYKEAAVQIALEGGKLDQTSGVAVGLASDFDTLGQYTGDLVDKGEALAVTFSGVTGRLDEFRDSVQAAIKGYVGFDSVLTKAQDTAQAVADAYNEANDLSGSDQIAPLAIDATAFGASLDQAISDATTFYTQINRLADTGSTSFALQLAELGPEASGILSSALDLDDAGRQKLETSARYAAFLASDAFKKEMNSQMADQNEAYARILQGGGSLGDVQSYIAAQVAGVGAEWEKQWDINHPNLPLNVTPDLVDPTPEQLSLFSQKLSGQIVVTPNVRMPGDSKDGTPLTNTYSDMSNGSSITLPANLDSKTLAASLAVWQENQSATPAELQALLNKPGLNADLDNWVATRGAIQIEAAVRPYIVGSSLGSGDVYKRAHGGPIGTPRYAGGGLHGRVPGSGSTTSDSVWARLSQGEYINDASSRNFWGTDFFDSLNRKMLPTAFLGMLSAAASSNNGPQKVTNVNVTQVNPVTRDPLKELREKSEAVAAGIWE
jgi:TP901 family phage tail tape measure protein